jgi:tetratricopeptide (TPR) repeat protein
VFEEAIDQTLRLYPTRILAHCLLPNHWHSILGPENDGDLSAFPQLLTNHTHAMLATAKNKVGYGHLYQRRFKSFPVETDEHFDSVVRYVERNAMRAKLVARAESWQWGSLWPQGWRDSRLRSNLLPWALLFKRFQRRKARVWDSSLTLTQKTASMNRMRDGMNQHVSWQQAAERFEQNEKWSEAEGVYRQVLQAEPMQVEAWYRLGLLYMTLNRDADAGGCFLQAVRREPEYVEALTMLGITHGKAGNPGEAEDCFRNAVRIRPEYEKAHLNLGVCLAEQRRSEEAAASFREALRLRPDYAEAHYNLGTTYKEMGRRDEAIASFRSALDYKPDYADAMNNLGLSLNEVGRTGEAVIILRQAIRLKSSSIEAHNNLALALSDQGNSMRRWCHLITPYV